MFCALTYSGHFAETEPYNLQSVVTYFTHRTQCFQGCQLILYFFNYITLTQSPDTKGVFGYFYLGSEGFSDFIPVSVSEGNQNPGLTLDKRKRKPPGSLTVMHFK